MNTKPVLIASRNLLALILTLAFGFTAFAAGETILIDFGSDTSFRGLSVVNPDPNGNYWNSLLPSPSGPVSNLVNTDNAATTVDLSFSTQVGTDSFNGPAGATSSGTLLTDVLSTDIDAGALGSLGATNAAFDFAAGSAAGVPTRFELQQLDPTRTYDLAFFGSHKFNTDATTVYSVYTDNTYSTLVAFTNMDVHQPGSAWLHNRDTTATLTGLSPQVGNALYVQFEGSGGDLGYLNAMAITEILNNPPTVTNLVITRVAGLPITVRKSDLAADPDGDPLTFTLGTTTNGATLNQDSTFIHVPASTVADQFVFTVDDGVDGTNSGTVTLPVGMVTPTILTPPTASAISNGQSLVGSTLTGGSATNAPSAVGVPGSFAFTSPSIVPNVGITNVSVTFTPTDTLNYNSATVSVPVVVNGEIPTLTALPSASSISYGQTLADSTLSGGAATNATAGVPVPGTFTFDAPAIAPNAGSTNVSITFTADDPDYEPVTTNVTVLASKTTPTLTAPLAGDIGVGKSLASSSLTGGAATNGFNGEAVAGSFTFTTPSLVPALGPTNVSVTFTPTDTSNYDSGSTLVTVLVTRGVIAVLGSSVAEGYNGGGGFTNGSYVGGYAGQMTILLESQGWSVTNVSVPGNDTGDVLARFDSDVVPLDPDYVLIGLSLANEGLVFTSDPASVFENFRSGMTNIIGRCRTNGFYPLSGLVYPHGNYTPAKYEYVKDMNLLINNWDLPSLNLLGATDDGVGRWAAGYSADVGHPNTAGHLEMFYSFVPTLFDSVEAGRSNSPVLVAGGHFARAQQDPSETAPITFVPTNTMHSFTMAFRYRSDHTGTVATVGFGLDRATIEIRTNAVVYVDQHGTNELTSGVDGDDGLWHDVALTHHYARQETLLFVDGVQAGALSEQLVPDRFVLGGPDTAAARPAAPLEVDLKTWCVYRSGWNTDETQAQAAGNLQQASLEIYAALDDAVFTQGGWVTNRAQSLSIALVNGTNIASVAALAAPSGLNGRSYSDSAVELSWLDNSTNETGFVVQRQSAGSGMWSDLVFLSADATSYVDTNVTSTVSYEYRVAAEQGGSRSDYSIPVSVSPGQNGYTYREWISQFFALGKDTFLIDFNTNSSLDYGGAVWNTVTSLTAAVAYPLADTDDDSSGGYELILTDAFDQFRPGNGSPLAEFDDDAQDTLFVSTAASPGKGQVTFSGLNKHSSYDLTLFARRVPTVGGFDYRAQYTVQGDGAAVSFEWDAASNAVPVRVFGVKPDGARNVALDVGPPSAPSGSLFAGISLLALKEIALPGAYLVDFNTLVGPVYPPGQTWNTVNSLSDATPYALVTESGEGSAGYTLTLTDGCDQFRSGNGSVPGGFSITAEATCFALRDDVPLSAQMTFGGLDTNLTYDFVFLARRGVVVGGFDYSGTYTFAGAGSPVVRVVEGADNLVYTDAEGIAPDSSGNITLTVSAGPSVGTDFPVLNLVRMCESANTNTASMAGMNGDPDGDGIANLGEYARNLDPLVVDVNPILVEDVRLESGPDTLVGSYNKFRPAFEASCLLETTTNLASPAWQIDAGVSQSVVSDDGTNQTIKIERIADIPKLFLRLGIQWIP